VKILVLSNLYPPDFIGGYELVCRQVTAGLRGHGHEVRVLTSSPRCPVPSESYVQRQFELSSMYEPWLHKADLRQRYMCAVESTFVNAHNVHHLLTTLETFQPEIVYLFNLLGLGGLGLLACLHHLRIPWVWHLEDMIPRLLCSLPGNDGLDFVSVRTRPVPALIREFNRQIRGRYLACSRRVVEEIEDCGLRIRGQVELLPNWVQGAAPPPRQNYFKGGHLRIVNAGQMCLEKGIDILIAAAARLCKSGRNNFSIDLYGQVGGPLWQATIDKNRVTKNVTLKGRLPQAELAQRLGQYDVFAFPTYKREPFGCAPLEAAAWGCVPLLAENCGISEWLVHGVHCLKTERTAESFAQVLADILDGNIDLEPLGRRVAAVVQRDFHLDALLPRIEQTLANAARQLRRGAGTAAEAYQLALLGEKLQQVLVHESLSSAKIVPDAA